MPMIFFGGCCGVYVFDVNIIYDVSLRRVHGAAERAHESAQQPGKQQAHQPDRQKVIDNSRQ
jgi:hypothetical protein